MSKELELNLKLDNLSEDEREQLMKLVNKAGGQDNEDIIWKPNHNEEYYVIGPCGEIATTSNTGLSYDELCYDIGNVFLTQKAAEAMVARKKRIGIFENKMMEFAEGYEYIIGDNNYYLYLSGGDKWKASSDLATKIPTTIYMDYSQALKAKDWANKFYPDGVQIMDAEKRRQLAKDRTDKYHALAKELSSLRWKIKDIVSTRLNKTALQHLVDSLTLAEEQIQRDYDRYINRLRTYDDKDEISKLQAALNRERIKREELQAKVDEATTSSSLFIKFCRDKLGV